MAKWILAVIFVWIVGASADWTSLCPSTCVCKWSNSKKLADCTNASFTAIPNSLSTEIQVLILDFNPIEIISRNAFSEVGLENIHKIFMRNCSLKKIDKDAFQGLAIMVGLDLSNNELHSIHQDILKGNRKLRALQMNNNPLGKLDERQFLNLPALKQLELTGCGLERLEKNTFINSTLEKLDLRGNKFQQLSDDVFTPILGTLKDLNLNDNPWKCDCRLRRLRRMLSEGNLLSNSPQCVEPEHLTQKKWSQVEAEEFACLPKINVTEQHVEAKAGGEVTFSCLVSGDPMPETKWVLNGRTLLNMSQIPHEDQIFVIYENETSENAYPQKWTSLTVRNIDEHDGGIYTCSASNPAGVAEGNATLTFPASPVIVIFGRDSDMGLSLMSIIGICSGAAFLLLLIVIVVIFWVFATRRRRRRRRAQEKSVNGVITNEEHEKALLGTDLTDLTGDKCNNSGDYESVSHNETRISVTYIPGEKYDERLSELHNESGHSLLDGSGRLVPDLLDLPTRRGDSPSTGSGASTAPDTSKLPNGQQPLNVAQLYYGTPSSKMATLSHIPPHQYTDGIVVPLVRPGYVTLPRRPRPRVPSWASTPVPSPAPSDLVKGDTMYDSVGPRTTADGSSTSALSLNRIAGLTPIPSASPMMTPNRSAQKYSLPPYYMPAEEEFRASPYASRSGQSSTLPRSTPNILDAGDARHVFDDSYSVQIPPLRIEPDVRTPMSRGSIASIGSQAPSIDGRKKTPPAVAPKPKRPVSAITAPSVILEGEPLVNSDSPRKVPPRPPPKPRKRLSVAGSVAEVPEGFEDEGADGTEV